MKPGIFFSALLTIFSISLSVLSSESKPLKRRTVTLPGGEKIKALIADTEKTRETGLMGVDSLKPVEGMLFLFNGNGFHSMWMKNMKIPLDIVWLSDRKEIIEILNDLPPCRIEPCSTYGPPVPSRYVLEIPAGTSRKYKLKTGRALRFSP
ncbi:MAG TPA: DUF192 domain-containing protein [Nitrospiria bacterium]|nr:DUF192 domain-containing protein [Nitrospiria bacterium]